MTTTEILRNAGYPSPEELVQGWALMTALAKLEQYRAEDEYFAATHRCSFDEFAHRLHSQTAHEDFAVEDDFDDWRFVRQAVTWWAAKVEELRSAVDA